MQQTIEAPLIGDNMDSIKRAIEDFKFKFDEMGEYILVEDKATGKTRLIGFREIMKKVAGIDLCSGTTLCSA